MAPVWRVPIDLESRAKYQVPVCGVVANIGHGILEACLLSSPDRVEATAITLERNLESGSLSRSVIRAGTIQKTGIMVVQTEAPNGLDGERAKES
ncbi:hypothetical protein ONS96_010192 [Cadophora gregata f. sp. sojae]|nr:hypothetical protein ONS96_010192 [Cadophora gregata f. sp. sojae]